MSRSKWTVVTMAKAPFQWSTFLPLFGVGSALTVIYRQQADIEGWIHLPSWLYRGALGLGLLLIAAAVTLSCGSLLVHVWEAIGSWSPRFFDPPAYLCRSARQGDLDNMHEYWESFFGSDISDVVQDRAWHNKNGKLFWLIFQTATRRGRKLEKPLLVGSFSLLPLTKRAAELVGRGELVGSHFTVDHLVKDNSKAAAVYIGGVLASNMFARGEALARVKERIEQLQKKGIPVYARPVTGDGFRLVEKYGFEPAIEGRIGVRQIYLLQPTT